MLHTSSTRPRTVAVVSASLALIGFVALAVDVGTGAGPIPRWDTALAVCLNRAVRDHPHEVDFWQMISAVFAPVCWDVVAVAAAGVLWRRRQRRPAAMLIVAVAGAALLSSGLKLLTGRARPKLATPVAHASGLSFPSGHATTSAVAATMLVLLILPHLRRTSRAVVVTTAASVVLAVGFSRLVLGVHYVSDVLGGWLIGGVWVSIVWATLGPRCGPHGQTTFSRHPAALSP